MRRLKLDTFETDSPVRENFQAIEDEIRGTVLNKADFQFSEITVDKAYAGGSPTTSANTYVFKHNRKLIPKDIIITSVVGAGTPTILHNETDKDFIYITSTDACVIRCFIGTYAEGVIE